MDVAIYGATAAGVMAAVAAARDGATVVLLEPGQHVGGMVASGLGRADVDGQETLIGGLALEFARRVGRIHDGEVAWRFAPSAAERVFGDLLDEHRVDVRFDWRLGHLDAERPSGRIGRLASDGGDVLDATVFVDATYEGDLLAAAGVPFSVGRESRGRHGERYAGRRELLPSPHQFRVPVAAELERGLLPGVVPLDELVAPGDGDGRVQSFCYRLCLTDAPDRIPIDAPPVFEPERFELVRRHAEALGDDATFRSFAGPGRLPDGKVDLNSDGPVSTNLPGGGQGWLDADAAGRAAIADAHRTWAQGLLHVLATDARVPPAVRRDAASWGLPRDEFRDTDGWPHQLYVREGRRMVGRRVLTERDLFDPEAITAAESIGLAGYNIDIREVHWVAAEVSRFPALRLEVLTEGYLSVPVPAHAIPYAILLPRPGECDDLLVTCAVSASHVAYNALRLEPTFMVMGEAAGVAAALAVERGVAPGDVPVAAIRERLARHGARIDLPAGVPS